MPKLAQSSRGSTLAQLSNVPSFPPVASRLLQMLTTGDPGLEVIVNLMQSDAALSAGLLQTANSAEYGFQARIDNLQHALMLLGFNRVRQLAMTVALGNYVTAAMRLEELRKCWQHVLASALIAEEVARVAQFPPDRAYTAALLHDIGRLALLAANPEEYAALLRRANEEALDVLECEKHQFGIDHCEAGRILAEKWRFPQEFALIAGRHHDHPESTEFDILSLVHASCLLADSLGFAVVKAPRYGSYEEVIALLPEKFRANMPPDPEEWKRTLQTKIQAHENPTPQTPEGRLREVPAQLPALAGEPGTAADPKNSKHAAWTALAGALLLIGALAILLR